MSPISEGPLRENAQGILHPKSHNFGGPLSSQGEWHNCVLQARGGLAVLFVGRMLRHTDQLFVLCVISLGLLTTSH